MPQMVHIMDFHTQNHLSYIALQVNIYQSKIQTLMSSRLWTYSISPPQKILWLYTISTGRSKDPTIPETILS